jgi:hypothetical protein
MGAALTLQYRQFGDQPGYGDDLHPGLDKPESGLARRDNQQPAGMLIVPSRQLTRLISNDLQLVEPVLWSAAQRVQRFDLMVIPAAMIGASRGTALCTTWSRSSGCQPRSHN